MSFISALESSREWKGNDPADEAEITRLLERFSIPFPKSFLQFLRRFNGGAGAIGTGMNQVRIMTISEMLKYQKAWEVEQLLPGHILFGSDYGDFALLFDTTGGIVNGEYPVTMCPLSSLSTGDVESCSSTFPDLFYLQII